MDARVLEVQQWLNATYGSVSGFNQVAENGKTGWSTMYALTRALQHELGITALSNNFGPGTQAAITARGGFTLSESNSNIIRIVQGAFYAHGYNPNGFDGFTGPGMGAAVNALRQDLGLAVITPATLDAKQLKALFSMTPFVLISGGSSAVRQAQQYLNAMYANRTPFEYIPCDGVYSRDVQKGLVYAIQFTLGMSDSVATGSMGPSTRSGLQANGLFSAPTSSMTNAFVPLFLAACLFNKVSVTFGTEYTVSDSHKIEAFQQFCQITVTGDADYATWMSLLVSTGDPDRAVAALDTSTELTPQRLATIKNAGYTTVGRYLSNVDSPTALNKKLQPGELFRLLKAGISVFPIFQEAGNGTQWFTAAYGETHADKAVAAAREHGFLPGTTIYFAVDFDPTDAEISSAILPYFTSIANRFTQESYEYKIGVYGTRNVCGQMWEANLTEYSFVAGMSTGFSGNLGYPLPPNWAFDQIKEHTIGTGTGAIGVDNLVMSGRDPGVSSMDWRGLFTSPGVNGPFFDLLDLVEDTANQWVLDPDYSWDYYTMLVCNFYREVDYAGTGWDFVAGPLDQGFINEMNRLCGILNIPTDQKNANSHPVYELYHPDFMNGMQSLSTSHLFATANGYFNSFPTLMQPLKADIAGYAGDLLSVLNGYKAYSEERVSNGFTPESVTVYAWETILSEDPPFPSRFGRADLIEDAEGYYLATQTPNTNQTFSDILRIVTSTPSLVESPAKRLWDGRLGGSQTAANIAVDQVFNTSVSQGSVAELEYSALAHALLMTLDPTTYMIDFSPSEIDDVVQAFIYNLMDLL